VALGGSENISVMAGVARKAASMAKNRGGEAKANNGGKSWRISVAALKSGAENGKISGQQQRGESWRNISKMKAKRNEKYESISAPNQRCGAKISDISGVKNGAGEAWRENGGRE